MNNIKSPQRAGAALPENPAHKKNAAPQDGTQATKKVALKAAAIIADWLPILNFYAIAFVAGWLFGGLL